MKIFTPTPMFTAKNSLKRLTNLCLIVALFCLGMNSAYAQPAAMSINQDVSGTYANSAMTLVGGAFRFRIQENGTGTSSGTRNWQFNADSYFNQWGTTSGAGVQTLAGYNTIIAPNTGTASANFYTAGYNSNGRLPATIANNYYTYNITRGSSYASQRMCILQTSYNPVTISSVTQAAGTFGSRTISITTSGTPNASEFIYVRYSTNSFTSSTIVQATGSGTSWTATIPWQSSAVSFYVYTSNRSKSSIDADVTTFSSQEIHDLSTLNVNNNSGSNYSWTPVTGNIIVSSSGGTGAAGVGYSTFTTTTTGAFAALNGGTAHTGTVTVLITADVTTEPGSVALANSSAWTAMTINPNGARTVSGSVAAALIDLGGGDNVTIDGLNTGGNSLTISNTSTSATSGTCTIRFSGEAQNNTITNCTILGSATMAATTNGGTIFFSTATTNGNDNNTISNCNIGPAGANLPTKAIYGNGSTSTTAIQNSGVNITNNNIYDFFNAAVASYGIYLNTGNTDWNINYNRFYQTATRTQTTATTHSVIWLTNTSGNNFAITGNVIGRAVYTSAASASSSGTTVTVTSTDGLAVGMLVNVSAGTGSFAANTYVTAITSTTQFTVSATPTVALSGATVAGNSTTTISNYPASSYTFAGIASSVFTVIQLNVGTTTASAVTSNTIAGIAMSGAQSGTSTGSPFMMVYVAAGLTTCNSNTIGSQSATGNITYSSSSATATDVMGFFNFGSSAWTTNSNVIGGITASNSGGGAANIYPFRANTTSSVTWTCNNNIIGGTVANSISSTSTSTSTVVNGILDLSPAMTITGNTIRNMTVAGGTGSGTTAAMVGISIQATSANHTITSNNINTLSSSLAGAATVAGIHFNSSTGTNVIERNLIYDLDAANSAATINGINIAGGTATYRNNMIRLGTSTNAATTGLTINGINEPSLTGTDNMYFNSIYIGGAPTAAASNTFAFNSLVTTSTRAFQNNIFWNARSNSGSTGKHYAIQVGGTAANPAGLTCNYNDIFANGTGGTFGRFNATDVASLAAWRTATGTDANSVNGNPQFIAPTGAGSAVDLHIHPSNPTPVEGVGLAIGSVTDDYDGQTRSTLSPTDIGADAGNFVSNNITYYSKSTGNLELTSTWGTNTDGSGTNPPDFITDGQTFNIRNNATPTIGAAWTVSGTGAKIVLGDGTAACNFTIPSSFAVTGTIDIANNGTLTNQNAANPTFGVLNAGSTVDYNGSGSQTIAAVNYGNLTSSSTGARTLANSGTIGVAGTFTPGSNSYTITTSTIDFNGTGAQTVPAFNYNNLTISGARTTNNITLENGGTIGIAGTFSPTATFSSGTYVYTNNTIDFNSAGAQTIPVFGFYNNLSNTNNGNRTLANGTITIYGTYSPTTGTVTVGTSTIDFAGAGTQTIPASFYYNITNTGNGNRTWASSGIIDINNTFSPTTATNTITNSTIRYSSTAATTFTMSSFTTNVASRQYNNLELVGGGSTIWQLGSGFNMGVNGNFSITGAGTFRVCNNATANTLTVDGNFTLSSSALVQLLTNTTNGASATVTVTGNTTTSGTSSIVLESVDNTSAGGTGIFQTTDFTTTSTSTAIVNFGATTVTGNEFRISGNFSKSGTGTFNTSSTTSATGFVFNKTGTQTFSYAGTNSQYTQYVVGSTSTLQMLTNLTMGSGTNPTSTFTVNGILDMGTNVISGTTNPTFTLNSGATLRTANTAGITTAITTPGTNVYNAAANYEFNGGAAQNTGFPAAITAMNNLTINNTSGVTLNRAETVNGALTFTNGLIDIAGFDLTMGASGTIASATSAKYVKTSGAGQLKKTSLTTAFTFAVGNSAYNPITLTNTGTSDTYGIIAQDGAPANALDATKVVNRTWRVTEGTSGGGVLTVAPTFNSSEWGASYSTGSAQYIGLYNSGAWNSQVSGTLSGSGPFTVSGGTFNASLPTSGTASYFGVSNVGGLMGLPTITAVGGISASPNNGTATNGYVGSTVTISGSGLTGATIVRYGGSGGTSVGSFTVVNDNTITFTVASSAVLGNIYVQGPGGNATSAESLANLGYITSASAAANASYTVGATWVGGNVPPAGNNVTIAANSGGFIQVQSAANNAATLTVNPGAELRFTGGNLTTTDVVNNGTYNINSTAGTITTTTFTNNSGGTLTWTASNSLNIAAGGTLTNNTGATFTRGSGTVNFAGAGTIAGTAAVILNNLTINTGALVLTTIPTIDGIFTINNGNISSANSPIYSSNSTLFYNVGYGRFYEWGATGVGTIGTTPGYPNNVTINTGTFDMSANSGTFGAAALNGTLTINNGATFAFNAFSNAFTAGALSIATGGTLNMNTKTAATTITGNASVTGTWNGTTSGGSAVSIGGNLTINSGGIVSRGSSNQIMTVTGNVTNASGGTLTLSSAVGGDLTLSGNWSNSGTFNPASRQVEFNGSAAAQTITGATTFDYLKINNTFSTPTVTLNASITVNNQLDMTAGKLVLGTNNCTIGSSGSIVNFTATNHINTNSTGRLIQTVGASTVFYPVGKSAYNPISLDNTGGTSDTYGVYVVDATTSPAANNNTKLVNRYWNVNEGTGGGSNLTVVTQWNSPGEENANFASGTTPRIGLYPGSAPWVTQLATAASGTVAGSSKYTSNATFTANISTGGTFGAGKDDGFLGVAPTVTSFTPTSGYRGTSVVISGSGFTGSTAVTFGGTAAQSFTVDNDNQITAVVGDGSSGSVQVTNPSGSSSQAGFTFLGYITQSGASTWATGSSWLGGFVPTTGSTVTIAHDISLNTTVATPPATVAINSGVTFVVATSGSMTVSTSVTNAGTFTFGGTGSLTTPLVTNNSGATLSWTAAGTLNISASGSLVNNGTFTGGTGTVSIGSGGTLTNNGTFTSGTGTVNFSGTAGTVNGTTAITFNNLTINAGALLLSTGTAVDGTFRINGGNIDGAGAMPIYTSNSTLFYNTTYGRFKEWDATGIGTIGTTPGYPNNVTVNAGTFTIANGSTLARAMNGLLTINNTATVSIDANISTLTIGNGMTINTGGTFNHQTNTGAVNITGAVSVAGSWLFNSTSGATTVTGNVTNSGGSINLGAATAALNITGNFANTTGTFSMSSNGGGDLYVAGNLSNSGTFTPNSRAVFFNGTTQSVSGSFNSTGASNSFDFVRINNGTNVTLGANVVVDNNITFNSGKITLSTFNLTMTSGATITSPTSSNYIVTNSTGQLRQIVTTSNVFFPVGNSSYNPLTLINSNTSDTYGVNVLDGAISTALDQTYAVDRRWQITEGTSGGSVLGATAQYNTGEENSNYNSGTVDYLGFYNGTTWIQQPATRSGSNPFTVASNSNFNLNAANITTGTQYFAIGRDGAFLTPPPTVTSFTCSPNNGSSTSGYTGSTVTITGTNFIGVTGVSFGGTAAASYTVNSSTQITAVIAAGTSGSVSVTSASGSGSLAGFVYLGYITTTGATTWNTGASWLGGSVPPAASTVTIDHDISVAAAITNTPIGSLTVNSSKTITVSATVAALTVTNTVTNNGTFTFTGASGSATVGSFTNGGTGTLSWSAAATLNISAAGTLTNNGTFTRGTGTVVTAGAATINGSNAITFNNFTITTGAVALSTQPTMDGIFRINGGNISTNAPIYTSNSTLQYNLTYTRFLEWSATGVGTIGTTPGYPNNVTISTGTLTVLNADAGTARAMAGNLQVNTGCTFATGSLGATVTIGGNMTTTGTGSVTTASFVPLTVIGNITNAGSFTLGGSSCDLNVRGNFTNNGTFTPSTAIVNFSGSGSQTISGTFNGSGATNRFTYLYMSNGTDVTLATNVRVTTQVYFISNKKLILGNFDITLDAGVASTGANSSMYYVTSGTGQLKQTVAGAGAYFPVGNSVFNPITLTNSGTSDVYGIRVVDAAPPAAAIAAKTVSRHWFVTEAVAGGSNLTPVVAQYNSGEEGGSYNAGTTPYMGLYNATSWTVVPTTLAGSNPFTATSTGTNQFPATIPSGSYIAIGKDNAFGTSPNDFFRSITTGNWSSLSTWESSPDNTNWFSATVVPGSVTGTGTVTVRNGHTVTVDYVASPATLTIASGGTVVGSDDTKQLYIGATGTGALNISGTLTLDNTIVTYTPSGWLYCGTMTIASGGVFNNNCGNAFAPYITSIVVQNGGTYNHNAVGSSVNGSATDFAGGATTRTFGATSNCNITKWGQPSGNSYTALPATSFGNLTINLNHTSSGSWQQSGALTSVQGDFTLTNTGGATREFRLCTTTSPTLNIGGNLIINGGYLTLTSSSGSPIVNVSKGLTISSGTYDGTGLAQLNFVAGGTGDIDISGGTSSFGNTTIATGRVCNILNTSTVNVVTGRTFTLNGSCNIAPGAKISGAGSFTIANAATATLGIGSPDGITTVGTALGNIQTTTARTFQTANYVYTGTANQNTGTALPAAPYTLSISNTGTSGNNTVTLTTNNATTALNATTGLTPPALILNSGLFNVPNGKNIDIASGGGVQAVSGDFAATTPAASGTITFKGTGTVTGTVNFYPAVLQSPSSALGVTYGTGSTIRNTLTLNTNSFISSQPPTYATGSTLIYNSGGTYQRNAEWASGGAAIGTPHHVTIQGGTTLAFDFNSASAADRYMAGDLTLGVGGNAGSLNMGAMTKQIYVGGSVSIGGTAGTSTLTLSSASGGDIHVKGNWTRNSFGAFVPSNRAVYFDSSAGNQTITVTGGATFDFLIVDKAAGSVVLANDATVNQTLTLSNGIISTGSNKVIANSTVARTNGWVAGNLQKPVTATGTYNYEIGGTNFYRPVNLVFSAITGTGNLTATVTQADGDHPNISTSGLANNIKRYYTLTPGGSLTGGTFTGTYNFVSADLPSGSPVTANFVVRKYASSAWTATTNGTRTSTSTQASGISLGSTASAYAIGEPGTLVIATHPANVTICQGANTSFSSTATQTPSATAPTVMWEVSTNGGGSWATVSNGGVYTNATTGTLNITGATTGMNGYQYRATFTDINTSVTSNVATLTVTPTVTINAFSPTTSTRCQGAATIGYTTTANNSTGITYSLDATSLGAGNTINSSTGDVTYVAGYTGTSTITASAAGCNGPVTTTHVVTINPSVATPVFALGASSTRCGGVATITYTATATNNTGLTYSLDATSLGAGNTINSGTGAVTYTAGYVGTSIITVSAAGCNGPTTANHTVTVGANTWTGTTSTAWNVGTNWSCGAPPISGQDVTIPSTTNKPALVANTTVGALSIASGAFVTIGSNTLTINGAVSGSGTLTGSLNSNLTMNGSGTLNFTATVPNNVLNDFTVNSTGTVTLGTAVQVAGVFTPTAGTFSLGTNNLTLRAGSEATYVNNANRKTYPATGIVGQVGATFDYTGGGKFVVERYIPAKRAYRFITSSVTTTTDMNVNWMEGVFNAGPGYAINNNPNPGFGTHITGTASAGANLDWTLTNNPSLFINNNATQLWEPVYNSNSTLVAGYPYRLFVRGSRSVDLSNNNATPSATILRATGTLVNGSVTYNGSSTPAINGTTGNFSLLGNPYAAPVNWYKLTRSNVANSYTTWDANVNTRGGYVSWNGVTNLNNNGLSAVNQYIQPGQAFYVQTSGASPSFIFADTSKVTNLTSVFRPLNTMPKLAIKLLLNGNGGVENYADGAVAIFDNSFSAGVGEEDNTKFTNIDENLSIMHSSGKLLSIEGRPDVQVNDTVFLQTTQYRKNTYLLSVDAVNFDPSVTAYLKDAYLNIETPLSLNGNTDVPISITNDAASSAANRFMIVFKPTSILPVTITNVKAYTKEKGIQVDWTVQTEMNIDRYEVEKSGNGTEFTKVATVAAKGNSTVTQLYGWLDNSPIVGNNFYRIKVIEKTGAVKYTQIVKVTIGKGEALMSVYPNPVKGKVMNLRLTNMEKGKYTISLYNNSGQQVYTCIIEHNGGSGTYSISLKNVATKGAYNLKMFNEGFSKSETVVFE